MEFSICLKGSIKVKPKVLSLLVHRYKLLSTEKEEGIYKVCLAAIKT